MTYSKYKNEPYKGDDSYIFISYAHKDKECVLPLLEAMITDGFRIWFDAGIDPGTPWDDNIATHIDHSGYFIAFISNNYLQSDNCKDELNYARDKNIKRVLVYLEDVQLPNGMAMRLNRLQAIHYYTYNKEEDFLRKLYESEHIDLFAEKSDTIFDDITLEESFKSIVDICKRFSNVEEKYKFLFIKCSDLQFRKKLLEAVKKQTQKNKIDYKYIKTEDFTNEYILHIASNKESEFQYNYENVSVLILEDPEFLCGRPATQEKLFYILKKRYYDNKATCILSFVDVSDLHFSKMLRSLLNEWRVISF